MTEKRKRGQLSGIRRTIIFIILGLLSFAAMMLSAPALNSDVKIWYRQGDTWTETPMIGDMATNLAVDASGDVWAQTMLSGLYRWDGKNWEKVYQPAETAFEFMIAGQTIWIVTYGALVRCDRDTLVCSEIPQIQHGISLAAFNEKVYVLTYSAELHIYDGTSWTAQRLEDILQESVPNNPPYSNLMSSDDGTLWLNWGKLWRYDGTWHLAQFDENETGDIWLLATTPGFVWTKWSNGLAAAYSDLTAWDVFTWNETHLDKNWACELTAAPDGTIWVGEHGILVSFDGQHWQEHPLPDAPIVTEMAFAPDGTLWIQITDTKNQILGAVPILLLFPTLWFLIHVVQYFAELSFNWLRTWAARTSAAPPA
jgi:hypothetical protein